MVMDFKLVTYLEAFPLAVSTHEGIDVDVIISLPPLWFGGVRRKMRPYLIRKNHHLKQPDEVVLISKPIICLTKGNTYISNCKIHSGFMGLCAHLLLSSPTLQQKERRWMKYKKTYDIIFFSTLLTGCYVKIKGRRHYQMLRRYRVAN